MCWSSDSQQLLTASTDTTVRLWDILGDKSGTCLTIFKHPQAVSAVQFHPSYPQVFVTGCVDSRIRLWDASKNRVLNFKNTKEPVTAIQFSFDGNLVVVGLLQGHVIFYSEDLRYFTQLECRNRKGPLRAGRSVTGLHIRPLVKGVGNLSPSSITPSGATAPSAARVEVLVTTADSRLRLYATDTFEMLAKYKGHRHEALHMSARFSEDGRHILSGGEDNRVHIWFTTPTEGSGKGASRGSTMEMHASFLSSSSVSTDPDLSTDVTNAVFVPTSSLSFAMQSSPRQRSEYLSAAILTSDTEGVLRIFGKKSILAS
jgi:WD40 repeat protein